MKTKVFEKMLKNRYPVKEMISFMEDHPEVFDKVAQLAISGNQSYAWRAAYLLNNYIKNNDVRIQKFTSLIIDSISAKQDGHQRELLKILQKIDLDDEHEGRLFNICITIWENLSKQSSVRYTALLLIIKIAKKYPELANELEYLTEAHYIEPLSKGIKHSVYKIKNNFKINS
ncbi:MAG: hypothetical protein L3J74_17025 [Bacteroidales bacterium]|nr:hypothetical protein [Bacteroidales bacterium]